MEKRIVKVTTVGYFEMKEEDLKNLYDADTFEKALETQKKWIEDGSCDQNDLTNPDLPETITLEFVDEIPNG